MPVKRKDVIFHVAALAGVWGAWERYYAVNVTGTKNMLAAARAAGVSRFIHTSSPSAVWSGVDQVGVREEDCPYPTHFLAHYPETKALSEQLALAENSDDLQVCALRPRLIWGPGDPHLIPRLLERRSRLKIVGDGENLVGLCYIENAAYAHVLAADVLGPGAANAGKAYFITDDEPVKVWAWLNEVFVALGHPPITKKLPVSLVASIGGLMELLWKILPLRGEPLMTRFAARSLAGTTYYDLSNARRDFGYRQLVLPETGFEKMIKYFKGLE